jgi:hypothetical protein
MECGQSTGTSSPFGIWKIRRADKGEEHASITAETPNLESDIAALIKEAGAALRQSDAGGLDGIGSGALVGNLTVEVVAAAVAAAAKAGPPPETVQLKLGCSLITNDH